MPHAFQLITIHAPVDTIWQVIHDFGAGSRYLAMVTDCTVQGQGVGALRTLTYIDGSVIVELLEMVDEVAHSLGYIILSDTPFGSCQTTMTLRALGPNQTELTWAADFQSSTLPENEAVSLMEGMLADNCQVLKKLFEPRTVEPYKLL